MAPRRVPPLLHHVGGGIEGADETDGAAGDASGGADNVTLGPEPTEREARPAPALVDQRRLLDLGEDLVKGVFNRQHETGPTVAAAPRPAFIKVGELGSSSNRRITS